MEGYVDYSKLPRRDLQALCKQHKIPANKTNAFMAESLDALLNNAPRQQEEFQEEEAPAPDSPEVEKIVEKVKGKRAAKNALLPEPELDDLAGMLASSTLTCNFQSEITLEQAVKEPETIAEPVPQVVEVSKARRGRPRATKKDEKPVEAAEEVEMTDDVPPSESLPTVGVLEVAVMPVEPVAWHPKTWAEAAVEANASLAEVVEPEPKQTPSKAFGRTYARKQKKGTTTKAGAKCVEPEAVESYEAEMAEIVSAEPALAELIADSAVEEKEKLAEVLHEAHVEEIESGERLEALVGIVLKEKSVNAIDGDATMDQIVPELVFPMELAEELSTRTASPLVVDEDSSVAVKEKSKPKKVVKAKKAGAKSRKDVDAEPVAVEKPKVASDTETEESVSLLKSRGEPVSYEVNRTPVKKSGVAEDKENGKNVELHSLSIRKLVKECKERGLRTRGSTRSINL